MITHNSNNNFTNVLQRLLAEGVVLLVVASIGEGDYLQLKLILIDEQHMIRDALCFPRCSLGPSSHDCSARHRKL